MKKLGAYIIIGVIVFFLLLNINFISAADNGEDEEEGGFLAAIGRFFSFKWLFNTFMGAGYGCGDVDCNDGNECTNDFCNYRTGSCEFLPIPDCGEDDCESETDCDDNNECTMDYCDTVDGSCYYLDIPGCGEDDCLHLNCDDFDPCTIDDCLGGECVHNEILNCAGECEDESDCDDDNECTRDYCDSKKNCHNENIWGCDENLCLNIDCDDDNPCTLDDCDMETGSCENILIPGCEINLCGVVKCDDGDECTRDYCNPQTKNCESMQILNCVRVCDNTVCDDGDICTEDECINHGSYITCTYSGIWNCDPNKDLCKNVNCDDKDDCTRDDCDIETGSCEHTLIPDCKSCRGTIDCQDGNKCNGNEICSNGACKLGTALNCDDGNACTSDSCNPQTGCSHTAIEDCCTTKRCFFNIECDDFQNCTIDTCVKQEGFSQGICQHKANNSICDDGNICNGVEYCELSCNFGSCELRKQPLDCDDKNECTLDSCDAKEGCQNVKEDSLCDDGIACTLDKCGEFGCEYAPNNSRCEGSEVCTPLEGCKQTTCSGCLDCDDFFGFCDYNKCVSDCYQEGGCYFKGNIFFRENCIPLSEACEEIKNCDDYSDKECKRDPCDLKDCSLVNGECVYVCEPKCEDKTCGDDGCSGSCGDCELTENCELGNCVEKDIGFPEGTRVLMSDKTYKNIEEIVVGDLITSLDSNEKSIGEVLKGYEKVSKNICEIVFTDGSNLMTTKRVFMKTEKEWKIVEDIEDYVKIGTFEVLNSSDKVLFDDLTYKTIDRVECLDESRIIYHLKSSINTYFVEVASSVVVYGVGTPCASSCVGRVCGDDGCGGSCGDCASGEACSLGACVEGECWIANDCICHYEQDFREIFYGARPSGGWGDDPLCGRSLKNPYLHYYCNERDLEEVPSGSIPVVPPSTISTTGTPVRIGLSDEAKEWVMKMSVGHNVVLESGKPINKGDYFVTKRPGFKEQFWRFNGVDGAGNIMIGGILYASSLTLNDGSHAGLISSGGTLTAGWGGSLVDEEKEKDEELGLKSGAIKSSDSGTGSVYSSGEDYFMSDRVCVEGETLYIEKFEEEGGESCSPEKGCPGICHVWNPELEEWVFTGCCLSYEKWSEDEKKCVPIKEAPCGICETYEFNLLEGGFTCVPKSLPGQCMVCDPATGLMEPNIEECPTGACSKTRACRTGEIICEPMNWQHPKKCLYTEMREDNIVYCCYPSVVYDALPCDPDSAWCSEPVPPDVTCYYGIGCENISTGNVWGSSGGPVHPLAYLGVYRNIWNWGGCDGLGNSDGCGPAMITLEDCAGNTRVEYTYVACRNAAWWGGNEVPAGSSYSLAKTVILESCGQCSVCAPTDAHEETITIGDTDYPIEVIDSTGCFPGEEGTPCKGPYQGRSYIVQEDGGAFIDVYYSCSGSGVCEIDDDSNAQFVDTFGIGPEPGGCVPSSEPCLEGCEDRLVGTSSACASGDCPEFPEEEICYTDDCFYAEV